MRSCPQARPGEISFTSRPSQSDWSASKFTVRCPHGKFRNFAPPNGRWLGVWRVIEIGCKTKRQTVQIGKCAIIKYSLLRLRRWGG